MSEWDERGHRSKTSKICLSRYRAAATQGARKAITDIYNAENKQNPPHLVERDERQAA